jgi:hypothetical protein
VSIVETYPSHTSPHQKTNRKGDKGEQSLTVHLILELTRLFTSPVHLSIEATNILLALVGLHDELGIHVLGHGLQLPLPLNLTQEVANPLMGVGMFLPEPHQVLEQLVSFLSNSLKLHIIQARPLG